VGASALREPPPPCRACTTPAVGGAAAARGHPEDHIRSIRANRAAAAKDHIRRNRLAAEDHIRSIRANRVVATKDLIQSNRPAAEDLRQECTVPAREGATVARDCRAVAKNRNRMAAKDIIRDIRANRVAAAEDPIQSNLLAAEEVIPCILRAANQAVARTIHATVEGLIRSIRRRNTAQVCRAPAAGVRVTAGAEPAVD